MRRHALPPLTGLYGLRSSSLEVREPLSANWEFCACEPDAFAHPDQLAARRLEWLPATVPCTVAAALRTLDRFEWEPETPFDNCDYWFRTRWNRHPEGAGSTELLFEGLATLAEVFLNGTRVLCTDSMFRESLCEVPVDLRSPGPDGRPVRAGDRGDVVELYIRFRSLATALEARRPRARWRTRLVSHRNLRYFRTSLLGHMPGICPPVPAIGPWRPVTLVERAPVRLTHLGVQPALEGTAGVIEAELEFSGVTGGAQGHTHLAMRVGEHRVSLAPVASGGGTVRLAGRVRIAGVERWWPHTHGAPYLYPARIEGSVDGVAVLLELAPIGFRSVELRDPQGDPEIRVNDEPIFCRGACWTPIDLVEMSASPAVLRRALEDVRDGGMNMLRITGNMAYEATEFYACCDELGILVWQDFMFASMDYPVDDPQFAAEIEREVRETLDRIAYRPCLAVLCGGTEVMQQAAMLGLDAALWSSAWFEVRLPTLCREHRPDVPYCAGSPTGGFMPFYVDRGIGHYFGVGGYRRGMEDAWIAEPRFAAECLAFSIPPETRYVPVGCSASVDDAYQVDPCHPVPKDAGADWDFMDVTDHYVPLVFGRAPMELDEVTRVAARRAAVGEVMSRVQAIWRRPEARCRGALVWMLRDLRPGAGTGLIDVSGLPKAPYHYLRRVWAPVALFFLDRGVNGLRVIVGNDTSELVSGVLELRLARLDGRVVTEGSIAIDCHPRTAQEYPVESVIGSFIDSSHAYRFGPPAFDAVRATLTAPQLAPRAEPLEVVHLRDGAGILPRADLGLRALAVSRGADRTLLRVATERFAQTVVVDAPGLRISDNYFHLCAGHARTLVVQSPVEDLVRSGFVTALNAVARVPILPEEGRHQLAHV